MRQIVVALGCLVMACGPGVSTGSDGGEPGECTPIAGREVHVVGAVTSGATCAEGFGATGLLVASTADCETTWRGDLCAHVLIGVGGAESDGWHLCTVEGDPRVCGATLTCTPNPARPPVGASAPFQGDIRVTVSLGAQDDAGAAQAVLVVEGEGCTATIEGPAEAFGG